MLHDAFSNGMRVPDSSEIKSGIRRGINYDLLAVASLVIGVISLFSRTELIYELLAIVLGACSRKKCNRKGIATAGIVCGVITLILTLIYCMMFMQISPPSMPN